MSQKRTFRYSTCFSILIIFHFMTFVVQARHNYKVIVIERVDPREMNYLVLKYYPGRVVPDLGTEVQVASYEDLRKWNLYPRVEYGPGTFKEETSDLQVEKYGKILKVLLDAKNKNLEKYKDLNEGREQK